MTSVSESPERTGHPDVDAAIDAVVSLEDRPVAEHLAAYETAHALLRQALSDTPAAAEAESPSDLAADPAARPGRRAGRRACRHRPACRLTGPCRGGNASTGSSSVAGWLAPASRPSRWWRPVG